jgi:hypothetical protein
VFEFKFTRADVVRSIWVFLAAGATTFVALVAGPVKDTLDKCSAGSPCDWSTAKAAAVAAGLAAVSAGLVAVKNFVLKDGSTAKG